MGSQPSIPTSTAFRHLRPSTANHASHNSSSGVAFSLSETFPSEQSPSIDGLHAAGDEDFSSAIRISRIASPPVIIWIGPALVCALMYALYNIFIKKGSASINPVLGGVILQFVAALLGCVMLSILLIKDGWDDMNYDRDGVFWAIWAGFAVGAAEILSFVVSGMGVQSMQSIPIIIGGSILFGTVLGYTLLHEMLTYQGWLGVALIAVGVGLVGTDPGGVGGLHG